MEQMLLGEILLNFHLIQEGELRSCLQFQAQNRPTQPLGEILVERGLINEKVLGTVLSAQERALDVGRSKLNMQGPDLARHLERATGHEYLAVAKKLGVSDLHLSTGSSPALRLHGQLVDLPVPPLDVQTSRSLISSVLTPEQMTDYFSKKSLDARISVPNVGRFRANVFRHYGGIGAVFRVLPDDVIPLDELGLAPIVREFADFKSGLVLITGTTACGKTTTLGALIDLINKNYKLHVITLEDPIETVFKSDKSLITQREMNTHTSSYAEALRAAVREDPDVIVVGEMRDPETVATALTAAETGHLVFGTLHTRSAHSTIVRIIDQFPEQKRAHVRTMLAGSLRAVLCQELVPNIDNDGRCPATEVMLVNSAISNLIRENREWQIPMVMELNRTRGMQLMDESLADLVDRNLVSVEEALTRATDRARFMAPA